MDCDVLFIFGMAITWQIEVRPLPIGNLSFLVLLPRSSAAKRAIHST